MIAATFVGSSNLDCIGYRRGTMYVRFVKGGCYTYKGVPSSCTRTCSMPKALGNFSTNTFVLRSRTNDSLKTRFTYLPQSDLFHKTDSF